MKASDYLKTEGYVNIDVPVNQIAFEFGVKWDEFEQTQLFIYISDTQKIEEDEYAEEDLEYKTSPLYKERSSEEVVANDKDVEIVEEEESAGVKAYKEWNSKLNSILLNVRKENVPVARVHKKGRKVVVLIPSVNKDLFVREIEAAIEDGFECVYEFLTTKDHRKLSISDIINLLARRSLYLNSDKSYKKLPNTSFIDNYSIFAKGNIAINYQKEIKCIEDEKPREKDVKNTFIDVYVKDLLLHIDLASYYQKGNWVNLVKEPRKSKVLQCFTNDICAIDDNYFLTTAKDGGLSSKYRYRVKKKSSIEVRTSSKDEAKQQNTKIYIGEKFIYDFNQMYKDIIQIRLNKLDCIQKEDEISGEQGRINIKESAMDGINFYRNQLCDAGGINIVVDRSIDSEVDELSYLADAYSSIKEIKTTYQYAKYDIKSHINNNGIKSIIIPKKFADCYYVIDFKVAIDGKETTVSEHMVLCEDNFEISVPEECLKFSIALYLSREYDDSLLYNELCDVIFEYDDRSVSKTKKFYYSNGFGVILSDSNYSESDEPVEDCLNLHIIPDDKTKEYDRHKSIRNQHYIADNEKAFSSKIEKTLYEMAFKACILNDEYLINAAIKRAVYIKHYPKNKVKKTKAYKRYFQYDANAYFESKIKEISKRDFEMLYPDIYINDDYGDKYVISVSGNNYVIEKTPLCPMGTQLLDQDGNIREDSYSRSRDLYEDNYSGFAGVLFHVNSSDKMHYCVAYANYLQNIEEYIHNFPHYYSVNGEMIDGLIDTMRGELTAPGIRLNRNTTLPIVFKFIREWAETLGE